MQGGKGWRDTEDDGAQVDTDQPEQEQGKRRVV